MQRPEAIQGRHIPFRRLFQPQATLTTMAPTQESKMAATAPLVLVTGAAGGPQGATGRVLSHLLLERGIKVRALVRTDDDRAEALRAAGAEVVLGNLLSHTDMQRAVRGVDYMYFSFAVQNGLLEASTIAAVVAAEAGLKGVINNSQWCADLLSVSPQARKHALAEAIFEAFPTPVVNLRGATYNINMIMQLGGVARELGLLAAPGMTSSDVLPLVSGTDVAAAADAILQDFGAYDGQAVLMVSQLRTIGSTAKDFSTAFGREVAVKTIDSSAWEAQVRKKRPNLDDTAIAHLKALWEIMREGCKDTALMARLEAAQARLAGILGRKPITFQEDLAKFTKAHAAK